MDATTLNEKIERLAVQKAEGHVRRMKQALDEAAKSAGHGGKPGDGSWMGETFRAVMEYWIAESKNTQRANHNMPKSPELVNYYRAKILDEVLEKLPLVKELMSMEES